MGHTSHRPVWDHISLAKILKRKNIRNREQLSERVGISRTTAYRQFGEDWSGECTGPILIQLSLALDVHPGRLIRDPRRIVRERPTAVQKGASR